MRVLRERARLDLTFMNVAPPIGGACDYLNPDKMRDCLANLAQNPKRPRLDLLIASETDASTLSTAYGLRHLPFSRERTAFYGR